MRHFPAKLFLAIFSVGIGLTLGVLVATIHFLIVLIRFPLDVYKTASKTYDERTKPNIPSTTDVWQRHIEKMDKKYGRDEKNSNL